MTDPDHLSIPLAAEEATLTTRTVETGKVSVRTVVDEQIEHARIDLVSEAVEVSRVAVGREIDAIPSIREEGDLVIIPVVEEILVLQKRLVLREEVHLRRTRHVDHVDEPVSLRVMRAVVERTDPDQFSNDPQGEKP